MQLFNKLSGYFQNTGLAVRIIYIFLCVIFVFLISIAIAPVQKLNEFENMVNSDSLFTANYDNNWNNSEFYDMVKCKTYKEAMLKLSEKDSIQLSVNLADSTINLYINGVNIHKTYTKYFEQDYLLHELSNIQSVKVFSQPLKICSQNATIRKEPIVVRQAPKDTIEASLNATEPITLTQNPAFILLRLEHGIDLFIEQDSNPDFNDSWVKFRYYAEFNTAKILNSLVHFVAFQKQEYYPTICIKIPANDLQAIYRALPENAFVVISLTNN